MKRVKVKMLKNGFGSETHPDGRTDHPKHYLAGHEHELEESLARAFVSTGSAAFSDEEPAKENDSSEEKSLEAAPENKGRRGRRGQS